ncbi:MAG: lysophospholipid acyltransferase family protein [Clostridia bacterium]|nr:lysophospholipid acyltransferase family protein [Clostridia bacterium]
MEGLVKYTYPPKKHNKIVVVLSTLAARIGLRKVKRYYDKSLLDFEAPCVFICNHPSFYDAIYAQCTFGRGKVYSMAGRNFFANRTKAKYLQAIGCFPKSLFCADIEAVKNAIKVIRNNGMLLILPEARLSTYGCFEGLEIQTAKLLKALKCPVNVFRLSGAYLYRPKWSKVKRNKGIVDIHIQRLFDKEELASLSESDIHEKLVNAIRYDDFEWLDKNPEITYSSRALAEGLENILFMCPHCKNEFTTVTNKDTLYCTNCGYTVKLNSRYEFETQKYPLYFKNLKEWYLWQRDIMSKVVAEREYAITTKAHLLMPDERLIKGMVGRGSGTVTLDIEGLRYEGIDNGKPMSIFVPMGNIKLLPFECGYDFEVYYKNDFYMFCPKNGQECVKWYMVSELLHKKYENSIKTTEDE